MYICLSTVSECTFELLVRYMFKFYATIYFRYTKFMRKIYFII